MPRSLKESSSPALLPQRAKHPPGSTILQASADNDFFATQQPVSGPLHAIAGVYNYGSTSAFPPNTWRSSNYWVDVLFKANT